MYRILIVEDDAVIAQESARHLENWGMQIVIVQDLSQVMKEFARERPHLVLMDISLPFYNGYYWCSEIRKVSSVPVIFLSSASENMNIVMAMNMGGDDFIAKPFDFSVLLAKVQAMLRRTYAFAGQTNLLEYRGVILNLSNTSLEINEESVELTKNEFRILQLLFERRGDIVTREEIMKHLWDGDCFVDDNTLAVNMVRLRKKLQEKGLEQFITMKKGLGYRLT